MASNYAAKDHQDVLERQAKRKDWNYDSTELRRLRQQRHRLKNIRPKEPAPPGSDPFRLAAEALEHLTLARRALGGQHRAHERLDKACELIKMLAWGPEDRSSRP